MSLPKNSLVGIDENLNDEQVSLLENGQYRVFDMVDFLAYIETRDFEENVVVCMSKGNYEKMQCELSPMQ